MSTDRPDPEGTAPKPMQAEQTPSDDQPALPKAAESEIATGLKRLYSQMLAEPMPDRFVGLLDELAKAERKSEPKS